MRRRLARATTVALVFGVAGSACNSSAQYEGCVFAEDPTVASGSRQDKCPPSVFQPGTVAWRDVNGQLFRGDNGVAGALVVIDGRSGAPTSTITGTNGFFGPLKDAALTYDLTARADRDVLVIHGMTTRYAAPSIDAPTRSAGAAWVKRVDIQLSPPIPANHTVSFFASGGNAYGMAGSLEQGVSVVDKDYAGTVTIHAVEHEKGRDLSTAVAYGKTDAFVSAASPQLVPIRLEPLTSFPETTFTATPPAGFIAETAELTISFSRSSGGKLATARLGEKTRLPLIPNTTSYGCRVRALAPDGAVSDSGERGFSPYDVETTVPLVAPPIVDAPNDGAIVFPSGPLAARGEGVLEHVLVAEAGTSSIRIVTKDRPAALPDFALVGAEVPRGKHTWTVRSFAKMGSVDLLGGIDARRYDAYATSAPRTLVFAP